MGCTKATKCPDYHSKDLIKGTSRCWVCSSTQHRKQDCPRISKEPPSEPGAKVRPEPKVKAAKEAEATPTLAPSAQQILQDTAVLLKNLRVSKLGHGRASSRALLDSGATACMRSAQEEELRGLPERVVQLAQGEVRLRVNQGGTLLTSELVDPIVSLHRLCQIGYRVSWTREGGCCVKGPGNRDLRVYTDGGCPEIDREVGLRLIHEIEVAHLQQVQAVRALRETGGASVSLQEALRALPVDASLARRYLADKFPSLPLEVLARIPATAEYEASKVVWNRRQRRSWLRSRALALHLFSGPAKKFWEVPRSNAHCICVDIQENLMDDNTYAFLQSLALKGQLAAVFGGPPCKTFSLSRYMPPAMPRPVRGRSLRTQWGFEGLTPTEREAILTDGILMFRMIWLYVIAEAVASELGRPKPFFGLEQPRDPESWVQPKEVGLTKPAEGFSSCWALQAVQDLATEYGFYFWHFDQGPLGHEKRKPTTIMSSIPPPPDVLVSGPGHGVPAAQRADRGLCEPWPSASWASWAPQLKEVIKREVISTLDAWVSDSCRALRDQENFLRHVVQGHADFRRDCSACLAGAARGARHHRHSVHDAWVLHVDLMGPFMEGTDEHGKVRYVLTGILTLPDLSTVAEAIRESDDIASGSLDPEPLSPGVRAGLEHAEASVPLSSLGPPVSNSLPPVWEEDLEDYEPSEFGDGDDAMALQPEEEAPVESEAERKSVEQAQRRWEAAAAALQLKECPVIEVPFLRTLPDKTQGAVAQGLLAMIAQLKYEGFMLRRLHSDRGREFNNAQVHRLCRQRDVYQTFTQGDDPKQNGRVEAFHARLKGRTRTLLKGAGAPSVDWPYAMRTAHASMLSQALARLGRRPLLPLPFGAQVRVRTRSWERELWSDRVQDAVVLAPSIETCKGHVVRTASGVLMHTTAVFRGAVQDVPSPVGHSKHPLPASSREAPVPCSAPVAPEVQVLFPSDVGPSHRIVGKQPPPVLRTTKLRQGDITDVRALSDAAAALLSYSPVPFRTSAALLVSAPVLRELAQPLPPRLGAGESSKYLLFGWFKHGGITGVSALTSTLPGVVQVLNALLTQAHPGGQWTTLGLFFSAVAEPHTDRRNTKHTCNYVLPLALPPTAQHMWVQRPVARALAPLAWLGSDGVVYQGYRLPLEVGEPVCVDPHSLHALPSPLSEEAAEDHVLLVGFSVPWIHKATESQWQQLQSLGFRLGLSRGGVSEGDGEGQSSTEKLFSVEPVEPVKDVVGDTVGNSQGLLEVGLIAEGHRCLQDRDEIELRKCSNIQQDVQEDTAAEGSISGRGVYARRLEARTFEPANWDRVKQYLIELGMEHMIGPIDALGVDDLEDFEFLYREDLMEAGASKEEAEAILGCTGASQERRSDPPPVARAGHHRPSRPAAQGFQGPAVAARIVHANDRAARVPEAWRGAQASAGANANMPGSGVAQAVTGAQASTGADANMPGSGVAQAVTGAQASAGANANMPGSGVAQAVTGAQASTGADANMPGSGVAQAVTGAQASTGADANMPGSGVAQAVTGAQAFAGANANMPGSGVAQAVTGAQAFVGASANVPGSGVAQDSVSSQSRLLVSASASRSLPVALRSEAGVPCSGTQPVDGGSRGVTPDNHERIRAVKGAYHRTKGKVEISPSLGVSSVPPKERSNACSEPSNVVPSPPLRFRPDGEPPSLAIEPEPLRFRPNPDHNVRNEGSSVSRDATICSLPLAVLVCKAVTEKDDRGGAWQADLIVDELPLRVEPGGVRREEARLDRLVVELRNLSESLRKIVLDIADEGGDCGVEVQELNRVVEMEEELVREMGGRWDSPNEVGRQEAESDLSLRISSLQEDIGSGCQAEVEGTSGAPLQTKIISVEEVLRDIEGWWGPMLAEYEALVHEKQVVVPITAQELAQREALGEAYQVIPAKLIFTLKAFTARRKVRCVACGNHLGTGTYTSNQLYAGGVDIVSLRSCLAFMVQMQWSAGVADIKTAFLNAELEKEDLGTKQVIVRTPNLWRRLGICAESFWDVRRALYGLQISPAAWSRCRDRTLPKLRLSTSLGMVRLSQFKADGNIWAIVPADAAEPINAAHRLGLLLVYVDDLMVLSTPQVIDDVIDQLGKQWELSQPELLDKGNIHYRGVEVRRGEGGVWVHQSSYTREILSRYQDKGGSDVPALKLPEVVPLVQQDPGTVRRAQQIAGELLWLSGHTRPELQFAVGALSRTIAVNADEAVGMGEQIIKYLRRHPDCGLWYQATDMKWGEEGDLSVPMGANTLVGFCDASFAPSSSRSLQSTLAFYSGSLIGWSSTRQGLTTLSTAESELVGITSLFTELQALEPLLSEINGAPVTLQMHSDSQAAIAICTTSSSNWRTRHLRLRASYVREALESGKYSLHHVCGSSMRADVGTKPLPAARFQQLVQSLGIKEVTGNKESLTGYDDRLKTLLVSLVVASLLQPADAQGEVVAGSELRTGRFGESWNQLLGSVALVICVWEVVRFLGKWLCKGCCRLIFRCCCVGRRRVDHAEVEWAGTQDGSEGLHVFHHVDDVVIIGPRRQLEHRAEQVVEVLAAPEGPGALPPELPTTRRRRRGPQTVFQFQTREWPDWSPVLSIALEPVGQDRYEYRPSHPRVVLRWHVTARTRLFVPEGTRLPVALTRFTGRRRTWLIDVTEGAPYGRILHLDDWKGED